jgi:ribonuclease HI
MSSIQAYTDGSCKKGHGGWAWIMFYENSSIVFSESGGEKKTTNNRMEIMALIKLISFLKDIYHNEIHIHIDSQYVLKTIVDGGEGILSMRNNKVNYTGWIKRWDSSAKNWDLWKELDKVLNNYLTKDKKICFHWVKGHSKNFGNDLADKYAQEEANKYKL